MAQRGSVILYCIWVVAISCFIAHYFNSRQNEVAVNRFKIAYSNYTTALVNTVTDMNGETGCYFSTEGASQNEFSNCNEFYKRLAENLTVTKFCKSKSLKNGCVPKYESYTKDHKCAGFSESMFNSGNQSFIMSDKSILNVFNMPSNAAKPIFAVDVNGLKKPNMGGYDLFSFVVMRNIYGSYYFNPHITYCIPVSKGGIEYINDVYK